MNSTGDKRRSHLTGTRACRCDLPWVTIPTTCMHISDVVHAPGDGLQAGNRGDRFSKENGVVGIRAGHVGPFVSTTSHIISIIVYVAEG